MAGWSWCPPVLPRFPRKTRPKPHSRRLLGTAGIWGSTFQVMRGPQAWPHCHLIPEISRIFFWMSTPILPCLRPLGSPLFPVPELSGAHPRFILDISIGSEFPSSRLCSWINKSNLGHGPLERSFCRTRSFGNISPME